MLREIEKDLVKEVNRPLDPSLIRTNYGGEKYITGYTVVRMLNHLTNGAWSFDVDKVWKESCTDKKGDHDVYHMDVTLHMYFDDGHGNVIDIKKPGTAGKILEAGAKNATNIYKSLLTLALRKAASYAGIGAELWLNEDESGYFEQQDFEPIWTEELLGKYHTQWEAIDKIQKEYKFDDSDMSSFVAMWDENLSGLDEIPPERIDAFVSYLKKQLEDAKKENQQ